MSYERIIKEKEGKKEEKEEEKEEEEEEETDLDQKYIFLINTKSGGRKAIFFCEQFSKFKALIYDMLEILKHDVVACHLGKNLNKYGNKAMVIICGGDGSIAWGCSLIDKAIATLDTPIPFPTMCSLPLGTGNDLTRSLGWGCMEPPRENVLELIADISFALRITKRLSKLDRWKVDYKLNDNNNNNSCDETNKYIQQFDPPLPSSFLCYLSFGYDAEVSHKWEQERRKFPERYNSQLKNQLLYVKHGFSEFFKQSDPINDKILIEIDNQPIKLISNCRSFKLVNINSACNGIFFWGTSKSNKDEVQKWNPPRLDDGKIEVMATRGVHDDIVSYRVNYSHAHRIAQSSNIKIHVLKCPLALQIDGEAWIIKKPLTLNITLKDKIPAIVGYNNPRGVDSLLKSSLEDNDETINKARICYRNFLYRKHAIISPYNNMFAPKANNINEIGTIATTNANAITTTLSSLSLSSSSLGTWLNNVFNNTTSSLIQKQVNNNNNNDEETQMDFDVQQIQNAAHNNIINQFQEKKQQEQKKTYHNHLYHKREEYVVSSDVTNNIISDLYRPNLISNKQDQNQQKGMLLDRFAWWKITKQKNPSIDAEVVKNALSPKQDDVRRTKSAMVLSHN